MKNELITRIVDYLSTMDKLVYFFDDDCIVLGLKHATDVSQKSSYIWKEQAIKYYENMNEIAVNASDGLSNDDEDSIKNNYIRLKRLRISSEDMMASIESLDELQLEQLDAQIRAYNIMRDLSMGKNLLKKPESLKDYIFYLLELNKPSGNYTIE